MQVWLDNFNSPTIIVGLFVAAVALVLIDYFFATDWPCHFGYLCFVLGIFLTLPFSAEMSLLVAVGIWIIVVVLHFLFFRTILEYADDEAATE